MNIAFQHTHTPPWNSKNMKKTSIMTYRPSSLCQALCQTMNLQNLQFCKDYRSLKSRKVVHFTNEETELERVWVTWILDMQCFVQPGFQPSL